MKDEECVGDVWFHLVDSDVAVFFPLGEGFSVVVKLGIQCNGGAGKIFHVINIGWSSDGESVFQYVNIRYY